MDDDVSLKDEKEEVVKGVKIQLETAKEVAALLSCQGRMLKRKRWMAIIFIGDTVLRNQSVR